MKRSHSAPPLPNHGHLKCVNVWHRTFVFNQFQSEEQVFQQRISNRRNIKLPTQRLLAKTSGSHSIDLSGPLRLDFAKRSPNVSSTTSSHALTTVLSSATLLIRSVTKLAAVFSVICWQKLNILFFTKFSSVYNHLKPGIVVFPLPQNEPLISI